MRQTAKSSCGNAKEERRDALGHGCRSWGREWLILGGILVLGFALRLAYLRENVENPRFCAPAIDAQFHDYWARGLAFGEWEPPSGLADPEIRSRPFLRPPGYPYFLAAVYVVAGPGYVTPRIAQFALALISCVLLFLIARRWRDAATGLVAAALYAVSWPLIFFEQELQAVGLFISLLLAVIFVLALWLERPTYWLSLVGGILLGFSALVRPTSLLLLPVLAVWILCTRPCRQSWRASAFASSMLLAGCALAVAPATVRNFIVAGDFVLVSSNGGINLYIGNNSEANGLCARVLPGYGEFGTCFDYGTIAEAVEREVGRDLKASEVSSFFARKACHHIRENPRGTIGLLLKKTLLFWGPREVSHNSIVECERAASPLLRNLPGSFSLVMSLAIVGLAGQLLRDRRGDGCDECCAAVRRHTTLLFVSVVLASFVAVLPFFVSARYRLPVVPVLIPFVADALCMLVRLVVSRRFRELAPSVIVLGLVFAVVNYPFVHYRPDQSDYHFMRGVALERKDRSDEAAWEYRLALKVNPQCDRSAYNLGNIMMNKGDVEQAVSLFDRVVELDPHNRRAINNLGNALAKLGKADDAIRLYEELLEEDSRDCLTRHNLALVLKDSRRFDAAAEQLLKIVASCPEISGSHRTLLGQTLLLARRVDESILHLRDAVKYNPQDSQAFYFLGIALGMHGRTNDAIEAFQASLRLDPNQAQTHSAMADLLKFQGRLEEAATEYRNALRLNPNLRIAREALAEIDQQIHQ